MGFSVEFDARANTAKLGDQHLVFHCHHYNSTLQKTLEEGLGQQAAELLMIASQEAVRKQLQRLVAAEHDPVKALASASTLFSELGFGVVDMTGLTRRGGIVVARSSHYGLSWVSKFGERTTPACGFAAGFISAATIAAFRLEPERVRARETQCVACGEAECRFVVEVL